MTIETNEETKTILCTKTAAAREASDSQKPASEQLKSGKPRGKNHFNDDPQ